MSIRRTYSYSDRGSLKDIAHGFHMTPNEPPTPFELRMKKLYEHADITHNDKLKQTLGFIVMEQPGNQAAFPITLYRHRERIKQVKNSQLFFDLQEALNTIDTATTNKQQVKQASSRQSILQDNKMIKTASAKPKRSFSRTT